MGEPWKLMAGLACWALIFYVGYRIRRRKELRDPVIGMTLDEAYAYNQARREGHMCSCTHVRWAHWSNGRCAHCSCSSYDGAGRAGNGLGR